MVKDSLDFNYDAIDGVYRLAYTDPAAPQYPADTVIQILNTDGWTVAGTGSGSPVEISHSDPDMSGVVGADIELDLGVRLSPMKQYEMEHLLRGGDSDDTIAELVTAERNQEKRPIYDYDV